MKNSDCDSILFELEMAVDLSVSADDEWCLLAQELSLFIPIGNFQYLCSLLLNALFDQSRF